jgi:hypothetical protein
VGVRPEHVAQLVVRDGARPLLQEQSEELKSPRRKRNDLSAASQLESVTVEDGLGEAQRHGPRER